MASNPKRKSPLDTAQSAICASLRTLSGPDLIEAINTLRATIHEHSPFKSEPTDFVRWVPNTAVYANGYNPNHVAPPEMELLRLSIDADGYTQPIVTMPDGNGGYEVVDGFHRHRVGKEMPSIGLRFGWGGRECGSTSPT